MFGLGSCQAYSYEEEGGGVGEKERDKASASSAPLAPRRAGTDPPRGTARHPFEDPCLPLHFRGLPQMQISGHTY